MYTAVVPAEKYGIETVKLSEVRKTDQVFYGEKLVNVSDVKRGNKYITVIDENEKVVARDVPATEVKVVRETQESLRAIGEAKHVNRVNQKLRENAAEFVPNEKTKEALAKLQANADAGYVADWSATTQLIRAQAHDEVYGRFYTSMQNVLERDPETNLIDFVEEYKEMLQREFLIHFSGTSRSTNVVSNVMDDAKNEVIVKFLDHGMLYFL